MVGLFFAGHDTTASSISFAAYFLAKHPEWQAKAREEARAFLETFDPSEELMPKTLEKRLPMLHLIIMESWRLNPPAAGTINRWAIEQDVHLGSHVIPKGSSVLGSISTAHRSKAVWGEDADEFRPERFCRERNLNLGTDPAIKQQLLTFSYGSHSCLGTAFATIQVYLGLAHFISKHEVAIPKNSAHAKRCIVRPVTAVMSPVEFELDVRKVN
jgi:PHYB activation tagged suppressor 1